MTSRQTVVDREMFVQALRHMGEQDLLFLNRMVVERLNLLAQARSTVQLASLPRATVCSSPPTIDPSSTA